VFWIQDSCATGWKIEDALRKFDVLSTCRKENCRQLMQRIDVELKLSNIKLLLCTWLLHTLLAALPQAPPLCVQCIICLSVAERHVLLQKAQNLFQQLHQHQHQHQKSPFGGLGTVTCQTL